MNWKRFQMYKSWDELTQEEKIEYLKMEHEAPRYNMYLFIFALMIVGVTSLYLISIQNEKINDLYDQTGHIMSTDTQIYVQGQADKLSEISNAMSQFAIVIAVLCIIGYGWYWWKWRKFRNQIRIKHKEVKKK